MAKYKIEVELDIDFQKFFDNIPDGLFEDKESCDKYYELESIYDVLNKIHTNALMNKIEWMANDEYKYAEHHILIEEEISKQLSKKCKVTKL
tara:strand:- start:1339 stop:1614 length:276 start_codon:yes stop_codon:yes gene_type:complete